MSVHNNVNDIVVKTGSDGSLVMLRDIGTVELGAEDYGTTSRLNNHPTAAFHKEHKRLHANFPESVNQRHTRLHINTHRHTQ